MRLKLKLHPKSTIGAVTHVDVEVTRKRATGFELRYLVTGRIDELVLPTVATPSRADELWKHTCFEAFIRASPSAAYTEFNFAPSRQWAAYRFGAYRSGMKAAGEIDTPQIDVDVSDESCALKVQLNLQDLPNLPSAVLWDFGLSAVIEEKRGAKSYWALTHPPGEPDFHHSDCFALQIPPASRP